MIPIVIIILPTSLDSYLEIPLYQASIHRSFQFKAPGINSNFYDVCYASILFSYLANYLFNLESFPPISRDYRKIT